MGSHHVLVLTLSTFPTNRTNNKHEMKYKKYEYYDFNSKNVNNKDEDKAQDENRIFSRYGYYQLSPVPLFIKHYLKKEVTDVILLETEKVREATEVTLAEWKKENDDNPKETKTASETTNSDQEDKVPIETTITIPNGKISPADYFKAFLKKLFKLDDSHITEITVDPFKDTSDDANFPGVTQANEKLYNKLIDLYEDQDDLNEWRLWYDTHGGFRDLNLMLVSTARLLAVKKEDTIITNGIYSVYHSDDTKTDVIKDQTAFYFADSTGALTRFLAYGQFIARDFTPYTGDDSYCFISYRHDPQYLNAVRTVFGLFERYHIRFWFDQDIHEGDDWDEKLHSKNLDSDLFILLYTNSYLLSSECWKELIRYMKKVKNDYQKLKYRKMSLDDYYKKRIIIIPLSMEMNFPKDFDASSIDNPTKYDPNFKKSNFEQSLNDVKANEKVSDFLTPKDLSMVFAPEIQKMTIWKFLDDTVEISKRTIEDNSDVNIEFTKIQKLLEKCPKDKQRNH